MVVAVVVALPYSSPVAAQSALSSAAADAAAKSAMQNCINRIGGETLGLPTIEQRCSDLQAALQAAGLRPLIIDSSRAVFDRDSLRSLSTLLHPAAGPVPQVASLEPILRGLNPPNKQSRSW